MQVYTLHKLREDHVLPCHLLGCGFASPKVTVPGAVEAPEDFPLYHIISSDDLVPRTGALVTLGQRLIFPSTQRQRDASYGLANDDQSVRNRAAVQPILDAMTDMPHVILYMSALVMLLRDLPAEEAFDILSRFEHSGSPARKLAEVADNRIDSLLSFLLRRGAVAYQSITGQEPDRQELAACVSQISLVVSELGLSGFASAFPQLPLAAHTITKKPGRSNSAYGYIAQCGWELLIPTHS